MKKNFLVAKTFLAIAVVATLSLASCGKKADTAPAPVTTADGKAFPVAYVRMDSILSEYQFAKDVAARLEQDAKASQGQLQSKAGAFQKAAEDFQRRVRINAFVSQEAAQAEQAKVLRLQQEAEQLNAQLSQTLAQKQALMQEDIIKEIQAKIKEFNKDGQYKLILTNAGVLYAEDVMDITIPFLKFLNDSYKPSATTSADSVAKK